MGILNRWLIGMLVTTLSATAGCAYQPVPAVQAEQSLYESVDTLPVIPSPGLVGLEDTLQSIYENVNRSVVNIRVIEKGETMSPDFPEIPGFPFFGLPTPEQPEEYYRRSSASGFIWDEEGHIVTNNHVVDDADRISVTLYDGTTVSGRVVGSDADSDLAVAKVDVPREQLQPVEIADSTQVRVGQLVAAIGNPFGLEGTMTIGFVSALGRVLPAGVGDSEGSSYVIPDVIQTDAAINPGNSGGVLVDREGKVLGVTTAIVSPVQASAGIGFAIPSAIVQKVVPALVEDGYYEHPWLGISGMSLNPEIAEEMGIKSSQRGALVISVVPNSPADEARLRGSDRWITVAGEQVRVGGDIITAIDGQPVGEFDDLATYLARSTEVGQSVTLTVLRQAEEMKATATLRARPRAGRETRAAGETSNKVWLGVLGLTLTPEIADAMGLPSSRKGVLIQEVYSGSPADQAGLRGSYKPTTIDGQRVLVGGDVITAIEGEKVNREEDLRSVLGRFDPGRVVRLTILRDRIEIQCDVTLGERPNSIP